MLVKEIKVIDYSTGTAYRFSDKTGSWESIEALGGGKIGAGPQSGSGNAGKLATSSAPTSESTSRPALTKTGVLIPTTNTATKTGGSSEPTPGSTKNKGTDSTESTQSPTSPSSPSVTGSDEVLYTGAASKSSTMGGAFVSLAAGLVIGWILI